MLCMLLYLVIYDDFVLFALLESYIFQWAKNNKIFVILGEITSQLVK